MTENTSTQCNRCISAGGGDCATCIPERRSSEPLLTAKDLNCGNCIKQYHKECPMYKSLNDREAWRTSEVCGLACHPLALQVLAQPVVEELKNLTLGAHESTKRDGNARGYFVAFGIEEAIKLLKGGAP